MKLITNLTPVCIHNVQDIRNAIHPSGITLYHVNKRGGQQEWSRTQQLLESVHNTGKPTTKVALVPRPHEEEAKLQFAALPSILLNNILPEYHDKVFHENKQPGLSEQTIDSIPASTSAAYAASLLQGFNPQDGSEEADHLPKRTRLVSVTMSYKTAATGDQVNIPRIATQPKPSITSTYTDENLSTLFSRMQQKFGTPTGEHVSTVDLETYYKNSKQELKLLEAHLQSELGSLNSKVDSLQEGPSMQQNSITAIQAEMGKQNAIMISMCSDFLQVMQTFSEKLIALQEQVTNPATPAAASSKNQHWGALGS
jgi:hypothetical protein